MNHSPKYEEIMAMNFNWRLWHQNWITPKISVVYIFQNYVTFFFKITLRTTSVFNLKTSGWFLLNFKGSENKIPEKSKYHHFDTWGRFLPGRSHIVFLLHRFRHGGDVEEVLEGYVVSLWSNAPAMLQPSKDWMDGGKGILSSLQIQFQDNLLKFFKICGKYSRKFLKKSEKRRENL